MPVALSDSLPGVGPRLDSRHASPFDLLHTGQMVSALTELTRRHARDRDDALVLAALIEVRLARGDLAEAVTLAAERHVAPVPEALAHLELARGDLALAIGDISVATAHFEAAGSLGGAVAMAALPWRSGLAMALLRSGARREADRIAADQVALADSSPALAQALRTRATTDLTGARRHLLEAAREAVEPGTLPRLAAQIDTDLAGMMLLAGDPAARRRAVALLRPAERYAGEQLLRPLHARVVRLLLALGESPAQVTCQATVTLTVSQRRVAELAAEGRSNRDIAEELVVSVKAVEGHLSQVYRKLGISSRARLAGALQPA